MSIRKGNTGLALKTLSKEEKREGSRYDDISHLFCYKRKRKGAAKGGRPLTQGDWVGEILIEAGSLCFCSPEPWQGLETLTPFSACGYCFTQEQPGQFTA